MITEEQYKEAIKIKEEAQKTINKYCIEINDRFEERMKTNPIFNKDELIFSAFQRCPCGAGLAYPKNCGFNHYWDCSDILMGKQDNQVKHTGILPFSTYEIKSETANITTRDKNA